MTTIGVLSDTHVKVGGKRQLSPHVFEVFAGVDLILHAGDCNCAQVLDDLSTLAPVHAVYGNNCDWDVLQSAPQFLTMEVEQVRLGMAHGDLAARKGVKPLAGATGNNLSAANALSFFESDFAARRPIDCLVFGHSHRTLLQWRTLRELPIKTNAVAPDHHVLLCNPGSAGKPRRLADPFSCAILKVDGTRIEAELLAW